MLYRELPATPALQRVVGCFWEFAADDNLPAGHLHTIPVDGCLSIAYVRSKTGPARTVFVGPRLQALTVPIATGDRFWGIQFLPGASRAAVGKPGAAWRDKMGLLDFELPALAAALKEGLATVQSLENAIPIFGSLVQQADSCPVTHQGVLAMTVTRGSLKITDLTTQVAVSERQFLRIFRNEVGLTPKQFARICRIRATAVAALESNPTNWGEIAADRGFADQAHLTHEFRKLFGISPSEFEYKFLDQIEHGSLESR
jgi:AraC-like DNA-binding protein